MSEWLKVQHCTYPLLTNGSEFKKIPLVFLAVYFLFVVRLQFLQILPKRRDAAVWVTR